MIRLGIVGAGSIVQAHIDAAVLCGFTPVAICGRASSTRALEIAQANSGLVALEDIDILLKYELDAILIAVSVEDLVSVLEKCLHKKVPILVEKPVSTDEKILRSMFLRYGRDVIVGYNRRHYSSTNAFRDSLAARDKGLVNVNISELSLSNISSNEQKRDSVLTNSVHILDLISYLFGEIQLINSLKSAGSNGSEFLTWQFESAHGYFGNINLLFGTPENQSISHWSNSFFHELRPIESYNSSDCMQLTMPTLSSPMKSYKKKLLPWAMSPEDLSAKPGFLGQYSEFNELCTGRNLENRVSANLLDAANAVKLAKEIYRA
jgi:predicted dehydrogenase